MVAKVIEDALDALRFAIIASKTDRVTAAQIRALLDRRENV